jgi:hypothetical protein
MTIQLSKGYTYGMSEGRGLANGTRTARKEAVLAEDCHCIDEEQADVEYASEKKHEVD